jgi:hypothetical protein
MISKRLMCLAVFVLGIGALGAASFGVETIEAFGTHARMLARVNENYALAINLARQAQVDLHYEVQEWKDLLLRGSDPSKYDLHLAAFK